MYRRIELINHHSTAAQHLFNVLGLEVMEHFKHGLMGISTDEVADAWVGDLRGPKRSLPQNCKFFFTEKGWKEVGRRVVAACQRTKQDYRIIAIKETDAQVVWKDKHTGYEVAVQPKRKRK